MKTNKKNRGTISVDFLIGIILLVLGFAVVVIFYFNLGGTGRVDQDVCHESVILRGTLPSLVESYVPLKCRTAKICITSGLIQDILKPSECDDFIGEKGITTIKVKSVGDIEKIYAEELYNCWQMMGEGKVSLFNQYIAKSYGLAWVYPTCSICSRIAFNNNTLDSNNFDFANMDVSRYMMTHKIPGKELSYFEYMASENGKISVKENLLTQNLPNLEITKAPVGEIPDLKKAEGSAGTVVATDLDVKEFQNQANQKNIQLEQNAILFMQISAPDHGSSIKNVALTLAGAGTASFLIAPGLTGKVATYGAKSCASNPLICSVLVLAGVALQQTNVAYNRAVTAGYCGDVSVGGEARSGCSAVRAINYDLNDISSYCQVIESIP